MIETIEELRLKGIGFRRLTDALDTTTVRGGLAFHMFGGLAESPERVRERTHASRGAATC